MNRNSHDFRDFLFKYSWMNCGWNRKEVANRTQALPNRNQKRLSLLVCMTFNYICEWHFACWLNVNHRLAGTTWNCSLVESCSLNLMGGKLRHMNTPSRDREPQALAREQQGKWTNNMNMQIPPMHVLWSWKHAVTVRDIQCQGCTCVCHVFHNRYCHHTHYTQITYTCIQRFKIINRRKLTKDVSQKQLCRTWKRLYRTWKQFCRT